MINDSLSDEFLYGKEIANKAKMFKVKLESIDAKYNDFFKERKSHLQSQKNDSLFNHCIIHTSEGRVTFAFTSSVLPEVIKNECIEAFKDIYPVD